MQAGSTIGWIDWLLVLGPLCGMVLISALTRRHMKSVADFLSGGRLAGRYLLSVAEGAAGFGLISAVGLFEQWYRSGFAIGFWGALNWPIAILLALTGFVVYRYRQTRAMTLAQFFEMRYSRRIRLAAGFIGWLSGVVNYAIFPAVGARFLLHYGHLPLSVPLFGVEISTYALLLAGALGFALAIVMMGGQITTMVTDCVQGIFSYLVYTLVAVTILCIFSFSQFEGAMLARPVGESFVNPFDTGKLTDFNILFVIISIVMGIYGRMAWQGNQGYYCAARNPHEQKMGGILANWRGGLMFLMLMLLAISAYTFMHHPDFADRAAAVTAELEARIQADNPATTETLRSQMLVPVAIRHYLPVGVTGLFLAMMVFLMVSTDTTYLHAWGSMFIQDVVLPLRGEKPLKPGQQIRLLRLSILGVAVFAWCFSMFFNQTTYILMFFALTGSLYMGFAGSLIIGGLYWKRGTAAGAGATMAVGAVFAVLSFVCTQFWGSHMYPWLAAHAPGFLDSLAATLDRISAAVPIAAWTVTPTRFPISGQELSLFNILLCIGTYVTVSLLSRQPPHNMDRLLHRGAYAHAEDRIAEAARQAPRRWWNRLLTIDEHYTLGDRIIAWSVLGWGLTSVAIFLFQAGSNLLCGRWSDHTWFLWWKWWNMYVAIGIGAITTVWFTWGGTRDLLRFFRDLKVAVRNEADDGRVLGHVSAEDVTIVESVEHRRIEEAHDQDGNAAPL